MAMRVPGLVGLEGRCRVVSEADREDREDRVKAAGVSWARRTRRRRVSLSECGVICCEIERDFVDHPPRHLLNGVSG